MRYRDEVKRDQKERCQQLLICVHLPLGLSLSLPSKLALAKHYGIVCRIQPRQVFTGRDRERKERKGPFSFWHLTRADHTQNGCVCVWCVWREREKKKWGAVYAGLWARRVPRAANE